MSNSKRIWVWVGVAIVVVAVVVWVARMFMPKKPVALNPSPVFAPQGQLVPEFPKSLILDSNAAVSDSYSINYSSSTNQYTAVYDSSSTVTALYNQYKEYLPANGWTITNDITKYSTSRGLYASNASSDVAVGIVTQGIGSQTTITYLLK